ncbi:hypothetical protein SAMN05428989_1955 [Pseudoxanthomonas sp. GM95]|uniref:hypothetical protein n=1 Tax=Pseudoxanthomonas sp. GM95 TaxID=1881043 RepID=UPI0008D751D4|nr:hypothetical protein [Pseudoxanthomonas sp. GM95]SEL57183.1 hypothetical protein SAMN05428989_1955 [Pseudoxanthomonas sp. GM95]
MTLLKLVDQLGRILALPPTVRIEHSGGPWLVTGAVRIPLPAEPEELTSEKLTMIKRSVPGSRWV